MKKVLWLLLLFVAGWVVYAKWINPDSPQPWEYFRSMPEPESTSAWQNRDVCWADFRLNYPYHIQTIGLSAPEKDGSRILILSEPGPHVTTEGIGEKLSAVKYSIEEKTHPIGYDGWVKDIVVVISEISDKRLERALARISEYAFFSDYKPYFLPLSEPQQIRANANERLNFSASAAELDEWFLNGDDKIFVKADDRSSESQLPELIRQGENGVYYSKEPGFVAWIIPKGDISEQKENARRFTLDADIIVGAIGGSTNVAILGRERKVSPFLLPPLRVETILQLAEADKQQISQSYERRNLFAGKLPGGADWAPIYLSNDLINTEYGSLLNITDQMLKSWSQHGDVTYHNFLYRKPEDYAYSLPISEELKTPVLTFNWNTSGAAYLVNYGEFDVVTLNRTGSLPVTYLPEGFMGEDIPLDRIRQVEEKAYDFFSSLQEPNLVRVVQYASLYQTFSAFNITASGGKNYGKRPYKDVPREYALKMLNRIMSASLTSEKPATDWASLDKSNIFAALMEILNASSVDEALKIVQPAVKQVFNRHGQEGLSLMAYFLGHPRLDGIESLEYNPSNISEQQIENLIIWCQDNTKHFQTLNDNLERFGITRSEVRDAYVQSWESSSSSWIKTPSIVVSWTKDSALVTGGHNIDARILRTQVDRTLAKGQVRIVEENGLKRVYVAADDVNHITPSMVREIEKKGLTGIQKMEGKMLGGEIRPRKSVFASSTRSERGFNRPRAKAVNVVDDAVVSSPSGKTYRRVSLNGENFVREPFGSNILFPEQNIVRIEALKNAMMGRTIAPGEFKVISFVDDAKASSILKNYCGRNFIEPEINSIDDVARIFSQNRGKTFNVVGHIENGTIFLEQKNMYLQLEQLQRLAESNNVNLMVVGCQSGFQTNMKIGMANNVFSRDVAHALGAAMESGKDLWTFTHTLAKDTRLQIIVREMPIQDFGYVTTRIPVGEAIVAVAVAGAGGAGVVIVVSAVASGGGGDDEDDEEKGQNI